MEGKTGPEPVVLGLVVRVERGTTLSQRPLPRIRVVPGLIEMPARAGQSGATKRACERRSETA
jgi:hypothetical protein